MTIGNTHPTLFAGTFAYLLWNHSSQHWYIHHAEIDTVAPLLSRMKFLCHQNDLKISLWLTWIFKKSNYPNIKVNHWVLLGRLYLNWNVQYVSKDFSPEHLLVSIPNSSGGWNEPRILMGNQTDSTCKILVNGSLEFLQSYEPIHFHNMSQVLIIKGLRN